MILRTAKCLTIFAIVTSFSGCQTCPVHIDMLSTPRPVFSEYTIDEWNAITKDSQKKINADDLAMKAYIKRVEERVRIHNE